ncbi:MAG: 30S ribosomal protein S16 [Chlamydiae bacterium RIFCSPHIGHO2_12_FULL_49_11]|nr:MAG: 30S ribosomal protein S16 [Chlamydiae bacterium RIFCSPHIGHO2_12_FULL_49_11]
MALVMRLRQNGRKNRKSYRCVVTDIRNPRDGKYIDCVGHYSPLMEKELDLDKDKIAHWLSKGVKPTESVRILIKRACPEVLAR